MLRIKSAKVTASPGVSGWVQIHGFTSSEPEKAKSRGQLFIMVSSKNGKEGVEAISFERELVNTLREAYYSGPEEKTFDALRNATQRVFDGFGNMGEIEIVAISYADGVVFSSASGGARVLISRNDALATILESARSVIIASGFPKFGDKIIAGTKAFFEKVSLSQLSDGLRNENPESVIEQLTPLVYGGKEDGSAGAVILQFESEAEEESIQKEPEVRKENIPTPVVKKRINILAGVSGILGNISKIVPRKNIYIRAGIQDEVTSQNRKLTLSIGIILLVILIVSVGFGIRQKKINDTKKEYQGLLTSANNNVDQAISLASVNPEQSRQLFLQSESDLSKIKDLKIKDVKIDELQKKIEESRAAVLGEYVTTPELFLDLGLLSSGFNGNVITQSGGNIYVLDRNGSRVVSIGIDTKKSKVVAGPSVIENPLDLASYEDSVYILFPDGIYLVGNTKTKVIDKSWSGDALVHAFAGNLYVLDENGNQIYRYQGQSGNSFSSQQNWLSSSTKADFSNVLGWGLNGAIYVLYPNSKILKYSLGSPQSFSIIGVSPEIGNIDSIYADPDNDYIYLLDKNGKRVVLINKDGKYQAQYINDQIGSAVGLVASEAQKKIILLTGDKLLSIEIKNN